MKSQIKTLRQQSGLSLIESLVATLVTAATVGSVVPDFGRAVETRSLDGAAAQLETDIQYARSLAVAQNRNMRLSFSSSAAGSCYVVFAGKAGECSCSPAGQTQCLAGARPLRAVGFAPSGRVQLKSNVNSIVFDSNLGTSTPTGTLRFTSLKGREVRLVVNVAGRVRACTPSPDVQGYARC